MSIERLPCLTCHDLIPTIVINGKRLTKRCPTCILVHERRQTERRQKMTPQQLERYEALSKSQTVRKAAEARRKSMPPGTTVLDVIFSMAMEAKSQ